MTERNDSSLDLHVKQARNGDREAFSEIVKLTMDRILALTYRMTRDRQAALDLTQDSLVAAWENLKSFRGQTSFSVWLAKIASNKTLNYLKRQSRQVSLDSDNQQDLSIRLSAESTEKKAEQNQLAAHVLDFMQALPPRQRLVFELRFYKDMTFEEIAEATDSALGTAKSSYREAVGKLRVFALKKGYC